MIKINKARSNSIRNSNLKEKKDINSDKNRDIVVNHSQNIINIIKHIKNLDNH